MDFTWCSQCASDVMQGTNLAFWQLALPLITTGVSALSGLFSNRGKTAQQNATTTTNALSAPEYDDKALYMRNLLMDQYMDDLRFNNDFFSGYTREGLKNINQTGDAANRAIENILASRGLTGTSAGAASSVQNRLNTLNQSSSLLNSIPLLADQRNRQNLQSAGSFFNQLPYARRTTGTETKTGTVQQPGNMLGGLFGGLANSLFGLYGEGAFDTKPTTTTPTGAIPKVNYDIVPKDYTLGKS